jgi:arabinose-5-phosphate isomerase
VDHPVAGGRAIAGAARVTPRGEAPVAQPRDLHVVGIGSLVVDRIHRTRRILGADEKGLLQDVEGAGPAKSMVGGVVLNHLGWAAALGLRCGVFGQQPEDENGRFLRRAMARLGIEEHLVHQGSATSVAEIFVDDAGRRTIYMAPGATAETTAEHVRERHSAFIRRAGRLTTEVSQLPLAAALEALRVARAAGIPTVVDLDVPPSDAVPTLGDEATLRAVLETADLLKPSKAALHAIVRPEDEANPLEVARRLRVQFGSRAVVLTDGERGCAIAADGFEACVPGYAAKPVDTTGAGDAFLGGLLVALELGLGWRDAGRLANACGAACVEKLGAFPDDAALARARVLELWDGPPLALSGAAVTDPTPSGVAGGLAAFDVALEELARLRERLGASALDAAARRVREAQARGGRVHVTGVGKPEHLARYGAALLASTGTPATFLHATEAVHGSAGQVVAGDVVIAISNRGETQELLAAVAAVRALGASIVAVTGAPRSSLARAADDVLDAGVAREGGGLGLAPRASAAAELLVLAALSAELESGRGFTRADYHARHPGGRLGDLSRGG